MNQSKIIVYLGKKRLYEIICDSKYISEFEEKILDNNIIYIKLGNVYINKTQITHLVIKT